MSETPGDRLRKIREGRGFETAADAARRYGWNEVTYAAHERGPPPLGRNIRYEVARKYALAFGCKVSDILEGAPEGEEFAPAGLVQVIGDSAVGVWQDRTLTNPRQRDSATSTIPILVDEDQDMRGAVRVLDESMNKVFQVGEFAIFSDVVDPPENDEITNGEIVVVERRRDDLVERSLRVVAQRREGMRLECYSTLPRYAESIPYPSKRADESVVIIGRVVGRYSKIARPLKI